MEIPVELGLRTARPAGVDDRAGRVWFGTLGLCHERVACDAFSGRSVDNPARSGHIDVSAGDCARSGHADVDAGDPPGASRVGFGGENPAGASWARQHWRDCS
jgi:hypothetical protein